MVAGKKKGGRHGWVKTWMGEDESGDRWVNNRKEIQQEWINRRESVSEQKQGIRTCEL